MSTSKLSEADIIDFLDAGTNEANSRPGDPLTKARVRVTLDQLRPYDRNPRQSRNPKFDSILVSIETRGLDHPPNISRRHPDDEHYIIIDGGNTRLEILNILYEKYKALAGAAESDEERLAHHEKAQSFCIIDCIFKPWQSESSTLAGHMSENEERGDTLFIEKALAVQEFRRVYEEEDRAAAEAQGEPYHGKPLTIRTLAERITQQGWTVSHSHISRYEYGVEKLLPAIPCALWGGSGHPLMINIRRLEKAYTAFWAAIEVGRDSPQRIHDLFFETLTEFDEESLDMEGFTRALDAALAKETGLPAMTVCAEVGALMAGGMSTRPPSPGTYGQQDTGHQASTAPPVEDRGPQTRKNPTKEKPAASPQTLEQVQQAVMLEALALADTYHLALEPFSPVAKAWFLLHPLDKEGSLPVPGQDDARAAVWWALFRFSATWQHIEDMQSVFNSAFVAYLTHEPRMTVIDTVLLLSEAETRLPSSDRTRLTVIEQLIRQGAELKEITNQGNDDAQGYTQQ